MSLKSEIKVGSSSSRYMEKKGLGRKRSSPDICPIEKKD